MTFLFFTFVILFLSSLSAWIRELIFLSFITVEEEVLEEDHSSMGLIHFAKTVL
jgi:hypothetical protein